MADKLNKLERELWAAIEQNDCEKVKVLMNQKQSLFGGKIRSFATDENGMTAFMTACKLGHREIVWYWKYDIRNGMLNYDNDGRNALMWAACSGSYHTVRELVDEKSNCFLEWKPGVSLPNETAYRAHPEIQDCIRKALVKRIFEVVRNIEPIETMKALLSPNPYGEVTVNTPDENGVTFLMIAAQQGDMAKMKALVEMGADVNACDKEGRTPLWHVLLNYAPKTEMLNYLVDKGADVLKTDNAGVLPIDMFRTKPYFPNYERVEDFMDKATRKAQAQKELQLITSVIKDSPDELTEKLCDDIAFLEKVMIAGQLLQVFDRLPYQQSMTVYKVVCDKVSKYERKQIENKIREARQKDER